MDRVIPPQRGDRTILSDGWISNQWELNLSEDIPVSREFPVRSDFTEENQEILYPYAEF